TRRGYFRITPRGQDVLRAPPSRIDNKFLLQFEVFRQFYRRDKVDPPTTSNGGKSDDLVSNGVESTPDEIMRAAHGRIENELAQELLQRIMASSPQFFERCIVNLLLGMGYGGSASEAGRAIGRSGDDGIDGVIDQDSLGLDRVYIQAKRYAVGNNIGSGAIRDFFGSLDRHKASKGLFVTTSTFSPAARETASLLSKRIVLLDGEQMARLMIRHNVGCRIEETLHIRKIDEDFFD
ncbi:MAG: restriction endonuclease, partial [Acetobacteraceae bacterium]